ncbi:1-phosphatidylinositol 4,5-bisphosphate phosphodiesterase zeta-1 isoform X2 [Rhinatrema bivittatum]|nr:1-phosphatidylinositol 4,5-bisphosphate phosphodiesterase zeta-1 isoform X2 [Rhinatrema bivittatum]
MELFARYSSDKKVLSAADLLDFYQQAQFEPELTLQNIHDFITKYEPVEEAKRAQTMTYEGFIRMMNSQENFIFRKDQRGIYQDMTLPLCDYFISSSHNTYLIDDQLIGQSHLWGYGSALFKGCRCLEIDCWDGPDEDPIVYHGYTLTSKLLFKTVIEVIEKYAFVVSDYPVVLSLENHCSPKQQAVMACYLKSILGEKLLACTIEDPFSGVLPSPEQLKFKILIKNKKIGGIEETVPESSEEAAETCEIEDEDEEEEDDEDDLDEEEPQAKCSKKSKKLTPFQKSKCTKTKEKQVKIKVAMDLSNLVIYTKAQKFKSFEKSKEFQKAYENNSIGETRAQKLAKHSAIDFLGHTMRFITRIYPRGTRTTSSNYNPQDFWNVGCQMVALNFQTPGLSMDLQNGKFQDNGGCGYLLKPEFLRNANSQYDANSRRHNFPQVTLSLRIISGFQLQPSSLSSTNTADPLMIVEIHGVPADQAKQMLRAKKNNAFNPQWNETIIFHIQVPELALVRFVVEHQTSVIANEFLGQYTLPLLSMSKGYRHVPLLSRDGQSLDPAAIFLHVWYF